MIVETRWATMSTAESAVYGLERGPQPGVGGQVEGGEGVVEDVDLGPPDEGPGDGQALALAARHVGAALLDPRLQSRRASARTKSAAWAISRASHISASVASGFP